ncbi:MAG: RNA polymerase sigma-70 factor [Anaerolineae bacterium]|nr:RNA polymerase sigma-70 factor [Anaerolineae bacterium]
MTHADQFESQRGLIFSIAYRMLGSAVEAEDMVQETYLRYQAVPYDQVDSHRALLTTIVTRLCLNQMELARVKRETYLGPWLPEPLATDSDAALMPAQRASLDETISMAFLILLESLTPAERAVFLLREVFDYGYDEIASILGKEEAACRQLFSRAKRRIAEQRPRFQATPETHRALLDRFHQAIRDGDLDGLMAVLAQDVTLWADGGGKRRGAAIHPVHGREAAARFLMASTRLPDQAFTGAIERVNGEPALVIRAGGQALVVVFVSAQGDTISEVRAIGNPDKLRAL